MVPSLFSKWLTPSRHKFYECRHSLIELLCYIGSESLPRFYCQLCQQIRKSYRGTTAKCKILRRAVTWLRGFVKCFLSSVVVLQFACCKASKGNPQESAYNQRPVLYNQRHQVCHRGSVNIFHKFISNFSLPGCSAAVQQYGQPACGALRQTFNQTLRLTSCRSLQKSGKKLSDNHTRNASLRCVTESLKGLLDRNHLHHDIVWAQDVLNLIFHPIPMVSKFYSITTWLPCTFILKFGHHWNQIIITFLESGNTID